MSFLDQGLKLLGRYTGMDYTEWKYYIRNKICNYIGKYLKDINRASPISLIGFIANR